MEATNVRALRGSEHASRCEVIVRGLPEFFGLESGIAECLDAVQSQEGLVIECDATVVGFLTYVLHNRRSAEITWMAVESHHRDKGLGATLIAQLTEGLAVKGVEVLSVKTSAGPIATDIVDTYGPTRAFYEHVGFIPQMTLPIWEADIALLMVRPLPPRA